MCSGKCLYFEKVILGSSEVSTLASVGRQEVCDGL